MAATIRIPSVTGIDVELKVAGPGARSWAFFLDFKIRALAAFTWLVLVLTILFGLDSVGRAFEDPSPAVIFLGFGPPAIIYFLYHPILEVLMGGRTPGKRIAKVRLVRLADGGTPSIGAVLVRNVFRLIDSQALYAVGLATAMLTRNAVRLGDLAAGTVLVYDEPEHALTLDALSANAAGRLGLGEAQLVRELVDRWRELAPEVRAQLARKLLAKHGVEANGDSEAECEAKLRALLA